MAPVESAALAPVDEAVLPPRAAVGEAEVLLLIMAKPLSDYWPICSVLSSRVLAVFMTSTLFW